MPLAVLLAIAAAQPAPPQASIEGLWRSPGGNSIIGIAPCGAALCGTIVWASAKAKKDARTSTDQLVGAQILTGLVAGGRGWQGRLYIPDRKMRVTAKIELAGDRQLKVSGCALGKSLCRTSLWTRTAEPLPPQD